MNFKLCNNEFSMEFNKIAKSSTASCLIRHGSTTILCTVTIGDWAGFADFIPLTVDYFERSYAINKIPGGFVKREGRQRENEVLISRLIDRSIRSTIDSSFRFNINISCIVLSYNKNCSVEPLCITAASACLYAAGVPCVPVAAVSANYNDTWSIGGQAGKHSLIVVGNHYGMSTIEGNGIDVKPSVLIDGINLAIPQINSLIDFTKNIIEKIKRPQYVPQSFEKTSISVDGKTILDSYIKNDKQSISRMKNEFLSKFEDKNFGNMKWSQICKSILRSNLLWSNKRLDGRGLDEIRNISIENGIINTHGSTLFSRGKTQVLCVATISNSNDSQIFETLDGNENRKFILHYNFLCTSENERINGSPSRRDLGHGNLARNAFKNYLTDEKFIRVVSEVIDSDGSSSMATVCGAYLALKNAGIRLPEVVAGISVGIMIDGFVNKLLVDMTQIEDSISDMDLKVAGTKKGITSVQVDLKIPFLPWNLLENALDYSFGQLNKVISLISDKHTVNDKQTANYISDKNEKPNFEKNEKINYNKIESKTESNENSPKIFEKKHDNNPKEAMLKDQDNQDQAKTSFSLPLQAEFIANLQKDKIIEDLKKETQSNIYIKNNAVKINSKNLFNTVNRVLSCAFNSTKELYYTTVTEILDDSVNLSLINGRIINIKKDGIKEEFKKDSAAIIYKGRFGRWALHSVL